MNRQIWILLSFGCCQLAINAHHCPHFGTCLLEHSREANVDIQKRPDEKPVEPPAIAIPESFGKTHFIIGASSDEVKQGLGSTITDNQPANSPQIETHNNFVAHAFFSPDDGLEGKLIELIAKEQDSMKIAVFLFTNGNIAQAIVDAQKRGIKIEIVTDASCLQDKFNKIAMLHEVGVNIRIYKPESTTLLGNRMHHKYIIFGKNKEGKSWLWFGSFNLTKSADLYNQEGVIVVDNDQLIDQFTKQFELLKTRSLSYQKAILPSPIKVASRISRPQRNTLRKIRNTRIIV